MNTIIYLYRSRDATAFTMEKWQESDYCLIRLGVPTLLWKNLKQSDLMQNTQGSVNGETEARDESGTRIEIQLITDKQESEESQPKQNMWERIKAFRSRRRKTKRKYQNGGQSGEEFGGQFGEQSDKQPDAINKQPENLQKQLAEFLEELEELQIALALLGDNPYWTYCVYEDSLREKINAEIWKRYWLIPEFDNYHEYIWVNKLMQHSIPGPYIILGYADCLPQILCENVRRMRSVKWYLREKQYTQDLQDFLEDFYEEYGLAVEVHLSDEEWIRIRPASAVSVNILDFTREEKLSACDVADGSIWLDMDSIDGKNRRMEVRNPKVGYFSMKNHWKQRQKEAFCLDTINKNGYNT